MNGKLGCEDGGETQARRYGNELFNGIGSLLV